MSNLKDLFNGKISDKLLENSTGRDVGSSVESADYLKSNIKDKRRFIPHVDFSTASNFAIYGSAEKYYEDAYSYILKEYPYDGSYREKIEWSLSGSYLDRYIFENDYPRTTGYINFGQSYGAVTQKTKGYDSSGKDEWIYFKGHNVDYSLNAQTNPNLTLQFNRLNLYNTASQGFSNLELEGTGGVSVEFWLNKSTFNASDESRRQVILDVWNSGTYDTAGYGRFRVGISGTDGGVVNPNFHVELLSGSAGFSWQGVTPDGTPSVILSGSTLTGSWNHFALTFVNTGSQMTGRLFTNGNLTYTYTGGTSIGTITGSMLGQIGSLIAPVSGGSEVQGYGKLSASLDEFRFWKKARTPTQIGKYWFTQVGGGTNTDITLAATASTKYSYENPVDLGVYYKFNEGIINTSSVNFTDAIVIDYAGRVTNGAWTGYSVTSRNTGSAIVSASASGFEFHDPILYSTHPLVSDSLTNKKNIGRFHDETNNSSIYGSLPEWITSDDQNKGNSALRNLTQIMASYFDTLYLQTQAITGLKNKEYISGSDKPFPFVNRFIDASGFLTSELFSKATDLEYLDARNNSKKFTDKINELKNLIYKNIYNNLIYIYKTKGTQKSFRNLIRSFGVDKELINIRLYGDEVTYKLQDNYDNSTVKKRYADFYSENRVNAVVYQQTASGNSYSRGYIGSAGDLVNTKAFDFGAQPGSNPGAAIQLNDTSFTGSGGSFTISLWSKQTIQYIQQGLAARMSTASTWGNGDWGFLMDRPGGGANRMGINTSNGYKSAQIHYSERVDDGEWHLIVGGFDAAAEKVWINIDNGAATDDSPTGGGVLSGSWGTMSMSLGNVYDGAAGIGDYQAASQWDGSIDEVGFWSGSLSTADINEIYNTGCPSNLLSHTNASLLKSWYRMGDLSTDNATANTGEITDVMGNNDGTPKNTDGDEIVTRSECVASSLQYRGNTYELESFFPKDVEKGTSVYFNAAFQTASVFGCHTSGSSGTTWGAPDYGQFQVQSVRPDIRRNAAFFQLTCSNDGLGLMPKLTSSVFQDVYDGTRWNFAVRIKPKKYPLAAGVSGSDDGQYDVEFSGYNYVLDILNDSFVVTSSITAANAQNFLKANKRFFIGAHRTNTTGTVLQKSNTKSTSLRVWMDYLTSSVLQAHAKDVTNFGSLNPYRDAYITEVGTSLGSKNVKAIPELETLILNWDFDTVTSSDAGGNFIVQDASIASSGSNDYTGRWGWLGSIGQYQHTGYGYGFPVNDTGSIDRRYVHTLELQPPETLNSSDMVSLIDEEQNQLFSKDTRPESYFFAFEKSMYNIISNEILDIFATIVDFNNLIGEPVNRYRQEYKSMQKLRQLYFERVQNTLDLNKFVEYFKWLDSALSVMLQQLVPGSARFSENLRTMIESHVLERNKYWTKFPTLDMKSSDPEAGLYGINELLYPANRGLAPIPTTATGSNCEWWLDRANRDNSSITSGDSTVDSQRDIFRNADDFKSGSGPTLAVSRKTTATTTTYEGQAYALRNFTKLYKLTVDESPEIHGGSNFARGKSVEYTHTALKFGSSKELTICASSIPAEKDCTDVIIPNSKKRLEAKVINTSDRLGYISGKSEIFAPFSLFSSSVTTGYVADVAANFRTKTEIDNYHDDIYGDDKGIPAQGPFTERHVGGRQHRHLNINTSSATTTLTRAEAWNLSMSPCSTCGGASTAELVISSRTTHQPRATRIRDEYAKRPVNIKNIEWGTSSAVVGNYQHCYEILQTTGRTSNNRFFVKNEGFDPNIFPSTYLTGIMDFTLPRYDLTGSTTCIFVNRFSAPGGPEVNSRGSLDIYAEEFSPYNVLNYRNLTVRNALNGWQTDHCGQFGIVSVSGTIQGYRQPRWQNYDTLASYHKVNRNPRSTALINDFSREVEWPSLRGVILSNFNRTLTNAAAAPAQWSEGAESNQILETTGYFEVEISSIAYDWIMGIDNRTRLGGTNLGFGSGYYPFSLLQNAGTIYVAEVSDALVDVGAGVVGDKLRIVREKSTVYYQRLPAGLTQWNTIYTSNNAIAGNYYPRVAFRNSATSITNACISNPRYDNWFVQHDIPQSDLQYRWINNSYDNTKNQPLGYTGGSHDNDGLVPYSVPSGTTSITQSAIQFVSASDLTSFITTGVTLYRSWGLPKSYPGVSHVAPVDFVGMNTNIRESINTGSNTLGFPLGSDVALYINIGNEGTLFPATSLDNNSFIQYYYDSTAAAYQGITLNALMLHRNGPYGYPSWKQIRTGETPIARYQQRNNILSVGSKRGLVTLDHGSGANKPAEYFDPRTGPDSIKNFVEPPVTFKYRPLISHINAPAPWWDPSRNTVSLKHSYGNNKCLWTQRGLPLNDPNAVSIGEYLGGLNYKTNPQIYDKLRQATDYQVAFINLVYSEAVYPRGANTGLARTRARTQYAETASTNTAFPPTASLSIGSNGIDRGPNIRRTFWRDSEYNRNRYSRPFLLGAGPDNAKFQTTISNSCGNQVGTARSVWCFGTRPAVYLPPPIKKVHGGVPVDVSYVRLSASSTGFGGVNDGQDMGELNSANIYALSGLMGGVTGSIYPNTWSHEKYIAPSASVYYYSLPYYGDEIKNNPLDVNVYDAVVSEFTKGMKWRTAIDSGKNPWYDSYEAFAENIRGLSKAWTILPEFRISDNMPYYVETKDRDFRAKNDKFLKLNGANITQSADVEESSAPRLGHRWTRTFNKNFFKEYSFSDFQKYFGNFSTNYSVNQITLKCNAVKKLLPYKGFYPADRTTQLASLFSGALGQYVSGGAVSASSFVEDERLNSGSSQLALQSLLQPWFAPGILYNTIKSGIAVDWPIYTGSYENIGASLNMAGYGFISQSANTRFPFKSILNPLEYIPNSASDGKHKLLWLSPSYKFGKDWSSDNREPPRIPFAEFAPEKPPESVTALYSSAMHNYLAEIPNFFLKNNSLQSLKSHAQGSVTIKEGSVYVMDIYIEKTNTAPNNELIMIQDYYNGYVSSSFDQPSGLAANNQVGTVWGPAGAAVTGSYNGKYFGPKFETNGQRSSYSGGATTWYNGIALRDCDPCYAPVTPPYFYGKAKVRLIYTGSAEDAQGPGAGDGPQWRKILNNMTMSFKTSDDPRAAAWTKFANSTYYDKSTSYMNMMDVSASLDLKGVVVENPSDPSLNRWVISPYMETPVLDFSESQTPEPGYGRGMWSGYGEIPKNNKGIFFGIERSPNEYLIKDDVEDMTEWFRNVPNTDASTNPLGIMSAPSVSSLRKSVGEIANSKTISEAIVAIPFCTRRYGQRTGFARTTSQQIIGKWFFSLGENKAQAHQNYNLQKFAKEQSGQAIPLGLTDNQGSGGPPTSIENPLASLFNLSAPVVDTSISQLAMLADKYILPPELDFNKYTDPSSGVEPFAMYIMEFEHDLSQQDLIDIWQGVMPKIATTPELDFSSITHPMETYEFFGGKPLPPSNEIRWMVFKVKRKAHINYWSTTPSTLDDSGRDSRSSLTSLMPSIIPPVPATQNINPVGLHYSYNWPYDYFSLVELAQVETVGQFSGEPNRTVARAQTTRSDIAVAEQGNAAAGTTPPASTDNNAAAGGGAGASSQDPGSDPNDNSLGGG